MKKVTDFLEKYVQWLVLAIALLYVGYIAYSYLYTPPLVVKLGIGPNAKEATPANVDQFILDGPVAQLNRAIADKTINPPKVADVLKELNDKVAEVAVVKTPLQTAWASAHAGLSEGPVEATASGVIVNEVPVLPPAEPAPNPTVRWTVAMIPGANPKDPPKREDKAYFSGLFTINGQALFRQINQAFGKPNVPAGALVAEFVQVELLRQERQSNGSWGAAVVVPPLPINPVMAHPRILGKDPVNQQKEYFVFHDWTEKNQALLTQPPFYQTAADAEKWVPPEGQAAGGAGAGGAAAPAGNAALPPAPAGGAAPAPAAPVAPAAVINPVAGNGLQILVHDATLQEGKIYRYAVRYRLFNPLYSKQALASAKVAAVFDIASPDPSDPKTPNADQLWTGPITPDPRAHIFVQRINQFRNEAQFSVFVWKDGHWRETNAPKLNPGDAVSAGKGASRWTLVDVRKDPRSNEVYVIVMDEQGTLQQRDEKGDAADPVLLRLKAQAGGAAPAAAAR